MMMIKAILAMIFKPQHPKKKFLYAVTGGKYLGELLVFIEAQENAYTFLTLPEMKNRTIPQEKFKFGLTEKIVDVVEKLPVDVFEVCRVQYTKNIATGNIID